MPPPTNPTYFQVPMTPSTRKDKHVHPIRKPLLRLEIRDLSSRGAQQFLSLPTLPTALENAVQAVLDLLYTSKTPLPTTRSVTLILRSMDGVAYTTGTDLDDDHKEIHLSTDYVAGVDPSRRHAEILGVLTHEMVHCWQFNARGTCPGGLIEGIADYVRLRAGFAPPHWSREWDGQWDAGYQHTGYFLEWLEGEYGEGTVVRINQALREEEYDEGAFWKGCCGKEIHKLWRDYGKAMEDGSRGY